MKHIESGSRSILRLCECTSQGCVCPWGMYRTEWCQVVKLIYGGVSHKITPGLSIHLHQCLHAHDFWLTPRFKSLQSP